MASLFDQYEKASALSSGYVSGKPVIPEMTTAGIINANLEDDTPMFSKKRIEYSPSSAITHMKVCNNRLVLGMQNKITKIDFSAPDNQENFDFQKFTNEKVKIYNLFLDRYGCHLVVSLVNSEHGGAVENFYLAQGGKKPLQCAKMKGHVISSIAFNPLVSSDNTTGLVLIGTTKGIIFETELVYGEGSAFLKSGPEQYFKQVFDIGASTVINTESKLVTGLMFHKVSGDSYVVLATTPSHLFQFMGNASSGDPPLLFNIFNQYKDVPEGYICLPGNLPYSQLQLFYQNPKQLPQACAWMTEPGIVYAKINYTAKSARDLVGGKHRLLSYPADKGEVSAPLSIVLTEFHVLVLFKNRLKAICVLNDKLVYDDFYTDAYGNVVNMRGIVKDVEKGLIWAYSDRALYRYTIRNEDRHVWEIYLEEKEYDLAKKYCKGDPAKSDAVLSKQADDFFKQGRYEESAVVYAQTHSSFEWIALRFLSEHQECALRRFLLKKLDTLRHQDKTQISLLVLWLVEIFLHQMGLLRTAGRQASHDYRTLQQEWRDMFKDTRIKECASNNRGAIYNLMSNHGDEENLIYFTNLMKDFQRVIQYHLQHKNYKAALAVLSEHSRPDLFYSFSPALMQAHPKETVDAWVAQGARLDPVKLIPSLVHIDAHADPRQVTEAVRYLEFCVSTLEVEDEAIHNYLITLYARTREEDKLLAYLKSQDEFRVPYDEKYALRVCSEAGGMERACVHIYAATGLHEEAVDLALKVDVDLGKKNADRSEDNDDLRKKLWLKIARHVVSEKSDIQQAMSLLQECPLLKIEDVLPFFPDFVTIDHFKDAICSSLQKYNQDIEGLKEEMEIATHSTEEIRDEIQTFRNKFCCVSASEKCAACGYPILGRSFYLFPCRHVFHSVCIAAEVSLCLPATKQNRVSDTQRQLASAATDLSDTGSEKHSKMQAELDDLIASECLYCGDIMIRSIDMPFLNMSEYASIQRTWE